AVLVGDALGGFGRHVADRGELQVGQAGEPLQVLPGDGTAADHPDPGRTIHAASSEPRAAHSNSRMTSRLTSGTSSTSTLWPGVVTKMRPCPHWRVHTAGEVTGRCHGSQSRTRWVVVASTSM